LAIKKKLYIRVSKLTTNIDNESQTEQKISVSYKITVSPEKWKEIKPESFVYGDRTCMDTLF